MYKAFLTFFMMASVVIQSQTVFFYEDFGNGCSQGMLANGTAVTPTNGIWVVQNINTGPGNGAQENNWFISATEAGKLNGFCGESCITTPTLTNRSLHISVNSASPNIDTGANYMITPTSNTNKRAFIGVDCSLYSNITMSFVSFSGQVPGSDYAEVIYYDGISWTTLSPLGGPSTCSPNVGLWADHTVQLPASADGNPGVKIGFRWQNNSGANSSGISVAIDNVKLSGGQSACNPTVMPTQVYYPNSTSIPTVGGYQYLCGSNTVVTDSIPNISCEWIYMNSGSTLTTKQQCIALHSIWMKSGAVLNILPGTAPTLVYYETGAIINDPTSVASLSFCPLITYPSVNCTTGLKNLLSNENLILFPNPIINVLNVRFRNKSYSDCSIRLYNSYGQKLREENFLKEDNSINMADWPAGVYYLDLDKNGVHNWSKIIKISD